MVSRHLRPVNQGNHGVDDSFAILVHILGTAEDWTLSWARRKHRWVSDCIRGVARSSFTSAGYHVPARMASGLSEIGRAAASAREVAGFRAL